MRGVERGSLPHILQLSNDDSWPSDPHDAKVALVATFTALDQMPCPHRASTSISDEVVRFTLALVEVLTTGFRNLHGKAEHAVTSLSDVLLRHHTVLLRWLTFYIRDPRWTDRPDLEDKWPARFAAESLFNLYAVGSNELALALHSSVEVIELLISLWMWEDEIGKATYFGDHSSEDLSCPIILLFFSFSKFEASKDIIVERASSFSRSRARRFIECAIRRLESWQAAYERLPAPRMASTTGTEVFRILTILAGLLHIPHISKAYARSTIVMDALKIASRHPTLPCPGPEGSFPVKVSNLVWFSDAPWGIPPDLQHHIVPRLLDTGVLDIILDDMLTRSESADRYPFFVVDEEQKGMLNPLFSLATMCVHQRICEATSAALARIPQSRMDFLETGWPAEYWRPFLSVVCFYQRTWSLVPPGRIGLCDSVEMLVHNAGQSLIIFNHDDYGPPLAAVDAKQCSHCKMTVYCSVECQKKDWPFHRHECGESRAYRIGS